MFKKLLLGSWVMVAVLMSGGASADSYWGLGFGNVSFSLKNFGTFGVEDGADDGDITQMTINGAYFF